MSGKVKPLCGGAEAKASPNRANKLAAVDAKPRELRMGRMKGG